jgi:hypothetical protein
MEIVEFGPLNAEQRAQLEGDEHDPFDTEGVTLRYRGKDRHTERVGATWPAGDVLVLSLPF